MTVTTASIHAARLRLLVVQSMSANILRSSSVTGHASMPLHARPQSSLFGQLFKQYARHSRIICRPFGACQVALLSTTSARYDTANASGATPLRKQLKEEAKRKKKLAKASVTGDGNHVRDLSNEWELTVGIEVHAELNTAHKLFSQACTSVNADPNTHVGRFDAALPGAQPEFQTATLIPALRAALAMNCEIQQRCSWDRKHYFYQDQPNGYQITQYYGTLFYPREIAV